MIWGSGGSKSKLAKAAGAESAGQMRDEKLHAVVARSTFRSQNVQSTPCTDHFWRLRCRKSARRCGAKHISKTRCTKHLSVGLLLEVTMSKKCTPLWREAHFEVKMLKTPGVWTTFGGSDVEKVHALVARSTFPSQNVQNMVLEVQMLCRAAGARDCAPCQKWAKREGIVAFSTTTTTTPHHTTLQYTTLQLQLQLQLHHTTPHSNTLHYTTITTTPSLHSTTLHSTTWNYTTLHYTTLHYTTLRCLPLHYITLHYTPLHYITLHYLPLHYITLPYTPLHYNYNYTTTLH